MNHEPSLSVVVASHERPGALRRCLLALSQSVGPAVEAIVVADKTGLGAVAGLPFADRIKTVLQADPNLSRARNDGIAQAAGELVAFLDDDAVPEPAWAQAIRRGFAEDTKLAAATGPVIGRDGVTLESGPAALDAQGRETQLAEAGSILPPTHVLKLHGTNMAMRRSALMDIGGFDPAFRFHLDASDLAWRIAAAGHRSAWLAGAQVHHACAASARRSADLTPLGLHDIGASSAVFLRKHAPDEMEAALARMAEGQRAMLFRLARKRKLGPRDIERLMADLREGISEGRNRQIGQPSLQPRSGSLRDLHDGAPVSDVVLAGWRLSAGRLRAEARSLTEGGARVTILLFQPTMRTHRAWYSDGGWWEQSGGLFGRSYPDGARLQAWGLSSRVDAELLRLKSIRFAETPSVRFFRQYFSFRSDRGHR